MSPAPTPLQYPVARRKSVHPAPLLHTRPDFRELSRLGGLKSAAIRAQRTAWQRSLPATLRVMRRWHPDDPALSMTRDERNAIAKVMYEHGYQAGAGYKRS